MGFNVKEECVMTCKWGEKKNMAVLLAVGLVLLIGGIVFNVVVGQDQKLVLRPGFTRLQLRPIFGRNERDRLRADARAEAEPAEEYQAHGKTCVQHIHP